MQEVPEKTKNRSRHKARQTGHTTLVRETGKMICRNTGERSKPWPRTNPPKSRSRPSRSPLKSISSSRSSRKKPRPPPAADKHPANSRPSGRLFAIPPPRGNQRNNVPKAPKRAGGCGRCPLSDKDTRRGPQTRWRGGIPAPRRASAHGPRRCARA